jgi:acyl transferase domain-containing protein/thioesterase domain-containing protein
MSKSKDLSISETDIAVVGMAGRFPGARTVRAFWENLRNGVESVTSFTDEELLAAQVELDALEDPNYVKSGVVLDDVGKFDAGFFSLSPLDAAIMDPQHRHFLECSWEALENAGHDPERFRGAIGVFAGSGVNTYMLYNLMSNPRLLKTVGFFLLRHTGNDKDFLATRVSYHFNLKGPSLNVQTACSTSLVTIHVACQSLINGECNMALAGGVTIQVPHRQGYLFKEGEILSPDGHCRAFDADAKGTIFGSGVGVVVLRRLQDAIDDGDCIHAVIKGSAINNDGSTKVGYLAPSVDGQAEAIAEAILMSGVDADSITYVEAHGTGTPVGDPIEVSALTQAFRQSTNKKGFCGIGSVKPNIGHLDTAAGVASFIKVVLALENKQIPASLHFKSPNPAIDFDNSPFYVNSELSAWKDTGVPRTAGVSSLGVGGTNAHVILQEAPERTPSGESRLRQLLLFSAKSSSALEDMTQNFAEYLKQNPDVNLADVAYTCQIGRKAFNYRRTLVCADAQDALAAIESNDCKRILTHTKGEGLPSVVFMFPGGGAQYPNMGLELYREEPVYRQEIDTCLSLLESHLDTDLRSLMFPRADEVARASSELERPLHSVLSVFVTEYALAKLWLSWGVRPEAMTGHSLGEYAAACLAGVISLEDALALVACRGKLFEQLPEGGMLSVPLPEEEIRALLGSDLSIAAVNSPTLCVVSGNTKAISELEKFLRAKEIETNPIRISVAAHSSMLEPYLAAFAEFVRTIDLHPPGIPYMSNLTGRWVRPEDAQDPDYWVRHLRQTVRFSDGMKVLAREPGRVFLEVGPGTTLSSLARQHLEKVTAQMVLSSVRHPKALVSDLEFLLGTLGRLWQRGVEIDWSGFYTHEERHRVALPTYPFQHEQYWTEPGRQQFVERETARLLKKLPDQSDWTYQPVWKEGALPNNDTVDESDPSKDENVRVLVFFDDAVAFNREFLSALREAGMEVLSVQAGDSFYRLSSTEYTIASERSEDYELLLEDLIAREKFPDRIVHLWMVTEDETARPGSSFFHRNQERGFYSLLYLAQALGNEQRAQPLLICVVSNGMQQVAKEAVPYPEKATLLGPCKVMPREYSGVLCKSIDIVPSEFLRRPWRSKAGMQGMDSLKQRLVKEVLTEGCEVVAYREGSRWVQVYEKVQLQVRSEGGSRLRDGGVYLITGGLGGLGLVQAEYLARKVKAKLVLLGRTPLPERDTWKNWLESHRSSNPTSCKLRKIMELEDLGAEVLPVAADVANVEQMQRVISAVLERFGCIHGVIHAAGVVEDGVMQLRTQADAERIFSAKVHGTVLLDTLLKDHPLDFFVLFSSTSSILGPAGQVDYSAANAFLNAFAQSRSHERKPYIVAINWGIWQEVGMAARTFEDPPLEEKPTDHPLLERCVVDTEDEIVYTSEYSPETHWVLDQHRTKGGAAIVPGTGFLEIARAAVSRNGHTGCVEIQDLFFVEPLQVNDNATQEVRVHLKKDTHRYSFEVSSRPKQGVNGTGQWQSHAQGWVGYKVAEPSKHCSLAEIEARCSLDRIESKNGSLTIKQEKHLDFGPRWRTLRRISLGTREALALLELPQEFAADLETYKLHPALLDLALGFGMPLIEGYQNCDDLYVPFSYKSVRYRAPLRRRIYSYVRGDENNRVDKPIATFDVTITSEDGEVLLEVKEFSIKKVAGQDALTTRHHSQSQSHPKPAGSHIAERLSNLSPEERELQQFLKEGIRPAEGTQALDNILASRALPQVVVSSLDLHDLIRRMERRQSKSEDSTERFSRPKLDSTYVGPRDDVEQTLVTFWEELLGVERVGIHDNFFELGGYSLIAVRLIAKLKKKYKVEYPLSMLFEAPTIEACANLIREATGAILDDHIEATTEGKAHHSKRTQSHSLLVPLYPNPEASKPPFFLVAGMYGNVMNLRHLASHVGVDQPFYGIQARGLFGEEKVHCRFRDMAEDYLNEIRKVQPKGPYFLGGFSGGGITAYEMAYQLEQQGEEVALLVFLDTPSPTVPTLTTPDRVTLLRRRLARIGPQYILQATKKQAVERLTRIKQIISKPVRRTLLPSDFRSEIVGEAFTLAVKNYRPPIYAGSVTLFRPALDESYELQPGRVVNIDGGFVDHANYWGEFVVGGLDVEVVTGDHDSMVLEPHVRGLAAKLRVRLETAQSAATRGKSSEAYVSSESAMEVVAGLAAG